MKKPALSRRGFTLIEVLIVMAVFAILTGVATFGTFNQVRKASLEGTRDQIIATVREAQTKSMSSATAGTSTPQLFGVYFDSQSYTIFKGYSYDESDPNNFKVNLDKNLSFSLVNLPSCSGSFANRCVVFLRLSGEVNQFNQSRNRVTLTDNQTGQQINFRINQLGVINVQ